MSRRRKNQQKTIPSGDPKSPTAKPVATTSKVHLWGGLFAVVVIGVAAVVVFRMRNPPSRVPTELIASNSPAALLSQIPPTGAPPAQAAAIGTNEIPKMEINQAVMVTVELDFGPKVPRIADALKEIERRHQPDDGVGRTFAILDAYGEPTPDGRKLHLSMHVSSEKPGLGSLIFKRTGEVLWQNRIVMGTNSATFQGKNLLILLDNGSGKTFTVDGSRNPPSILDASIKELNVPIREFWPDGAEREVTYLYSACGCPVKVMAKRVGDRTIRAKDLPVIFPDDPAAAAVIYGLMGWSESR